jgi:predicted amidophosphoribosyltransferase
VGIRELAAALVDLVLPGECAACGEPEPPWCGPCHSRLGPQATPWLPGGPEVLAAGRYTGPLRSALLRYKERGRRDLVRPLADLLAVALDGLVPPPVPDGRAPAAVWLVPAPSRPAAARARGGDHVLRLCHAVAAARADVRVARPLRLVGRVRDSVGLDTAQRAANLAGKVRVRLARLPPPGAVVLLVDDVITTGATLVTCRDALAAAGVRAHGALVLCDATRRTPRLPAQGLDNEQGVEWYRPDGVVGTSFTVSTRLGGDPFRRLLPNRDARYGAPHPSRPH